MNRFERKFFVKTIPELSPNLKVTRYDRHFLENKVNNQIRIQSKDGLFELEKVFVISQHQRKIEKKKITEKEFVELSKKSIGHISRDSYSISENPPITLKVYHGQFKGLRRVEVIFSSLEQSERFSPPDWFGREITGSPLSRDSELLNLNLKVFKQLLIEANSK